MCPNEYLVLSDATITVYDLTVTNAAQTVRGPNPLCWALVFPSVPSLGIWVRFSPVNPGYNTFTIQSNGAQQIIGYMDVGPLIRQGFQVMGTTAGPVSYRITEISLSPQSEKAFRDAAAKILSNSSPY